MVTAMDHPRRLVVVCLAALASTRGFAFDRFVRGSGKIVTERREATGVARVDVGGAFEVEIRQGTQEGIELSGDDNLLPLIETRLEGAAGARTLKIKARDDVQWSSSQPIRVRIDLVNLTALDLGGSGRVVATGLHAQRLDVAIGGPGRVALAGLDAERLLVNIGGSGRLSSDGHAKALSINIGGSGDCLLAQLAVDDVNISIAGSGSAEVNADKKLAVSIAGSGRVRYNGAATPSASISGSGSVKRL